MVCALALCVVAPAAGQDVASTFEQLRLKVKTGDTVYVAGEDGREREAKILDLSASSLAVSIGGARSDLGEASVNRIRQRVPDGLRNGALIGFLVGGAGSIAGAKALESPAGSCSGGCVAVNLAYGGGAGALIGLGIDALIKGKKTIYELRPEAQRILLRPVLLSGTTAVTVAVSF
jgi:hypothetical protein